MSDETTETCPLCLTRPAEPGACATCGRGTMDMINDLAAERDRLRAALARIAAFEHHENFGECERECPACAASEALAAAAREGAR